jgi:hypothetical protein
MKGYSLFPINQEFKMAWLYYMHTCKCNVIKSSQCLKQLIMVFVLGYKLVRNQRKKERWSDGTYYKFLNLSSRDISLDWFLVCGKSGSCEPDRRDTPVLGVRADATNSLKMQCFCIRLDRLHAPRASNQTKSQIESTHTVVQDMMVRVTNQT